MPGDIGRYQLDYILTKKQSRCKVHSCHAYPGLDIDSDHNIVIAKCIVADDKKKKRSKKRHPTLDIKQLKNNLVREYFGEKTDENINNHERGIEEKWIFLNPG